jgi:peroxiredoxin
MKTKIKNIFKSISLLLFLIFTCVSSQAQQSGYEIVGDVKGLVDSGYVKVYPYFNNVYETPDSASVKDGKFHITGHVTDGPRYYELYFSQREKKAQWGKTIRLLINNGETIRIASEKNIYKDIDHSVLDFWVSIEGDVSNRSKNTLVESSTIYFDEMHLFDHYLQKVRDSIGYNRDLVESALKSRDIVVHSIFEQLKSQDPEFTPAIPYVLQLIGQYRRFPSIIQVYNALDEHSKNSFYAKQVKVMLPLTEGQHLPEFSLPDPQGKIVNLKDVVAKSKVTIVHFWAGNSYNQSEYQDELKALYKKFHDKGLNIISVSSDKNADDWKDAVQKAALPLAWYQVSDLKGKHGIVNTVYHEYGTDPVTRNTTNILLDDKGNIIAWDPQGIEMEYDLVKYLGQ